MPVSSVTSTPAGLANLSGSQTGAARTPTQTLGENDFLKLLAVQFQQQDPMQPMDDTAFIAQTAQFTSLQQMTQLSQQQSMMTGSGYIGRNVTVQDTNGNYITGLVTAVDNSGTTPGIVINGTTYDLSTVKRIEPVSTPATPATTAATPATTTDTSSSTGSASTPAATTPTTPSTTTP
ncbi:MAG TPA: flagellar hook capping FlgD N-terminal domain-containing protein [Candidatus Didemnitutus sp.]|nr:flagellar hook capping FlgD N-terminal domain-containing protein [Candidatus Didemnitutus sp.]